MGRLFYKEPDSKYFRLYRPYGLCCKYSTLPFHESSHGQPISKWMWLSSDKTLFTKTSGGPDSPSDRKSPMLIDLCFWPSLEIISFLFPNCVHPMEPDITDGSFPLGRRIAPRLLHSIAGILICHKTVSYFPDCAQFSLIKNHFIFPPH